MRMTTGLIVMGVLAGTSAFAQQTPSRRCSCCTRARTRWPLSIRPPVKWPAACSSGKIPTSWLFPTTGNSRLPAITVVIASGGNSLSVIDIAARKEIHHVELSPLGRPHGLWFAGGELYFTAEANMAIGRYDPTTNKVDWLLGTGQERTHMVLVAKDLKTIFTSNVSSNTISIIERTNPPQGRFGGPPPGGPGGPPPGGPDGPPPGARPDGPPPGGRPDGPPPGGPGGPPQGRPGGPGGPPGVDRAGNKPLSRWAAGQRASISRQMARKSGPPTWAMATYP